MKSILVAPEVAKQLVVEQLLLPVEVPADLQAAVVEQQVVELVVVGKSVVHSSTNSMAKEMLKNRWPVDPSMKAQVLVALEAVVDLAVSKEDLVSMVLDPVVQEVQVVKEVDLVTVQEDLQVEEFLVEQAEALVVIHLRLQKME